MNDSLAALVRHRASGRCEYCQLPAEWSVIPFEIDHIIARKHKGQTTADNLALSCYYCNSSKGPNIAGIDPDSGLIVRLFHPREDVWADHFLWDGAVLRGRTPVGRATIDVLEINLQVSVDLRQTLLAAGLFWLKP
jgi:hypothetical protein